MTAGEGVDARTYFVRELQRIGLAIERLQRGGEPIAPAIQAAREARAEAVVRTAGELPFERAARCFQLGELQRDALLLAVAADVSVPIGAAIARLTGGAWPTVGLVLSLSAAAGDREEPHALVDHRCVRDGLLALTGDGPAVTRQLRVDSELAAVLAGAAPDLVPDPVEPGALTRLVGTTEQLAVIERWAAVAPNGPALLLIGADGSGRRRWARAATSRAGWPLVTAHADDLSRARRLAIWHRAAVMLRVRPEHLARSRDATRDLIRGLAAWPSPLVVVTSAIEATALVGAGLDAITLEIGPLPPRERERLWCALLPAIEPTAVRSAARTFAMRSDQIARAARRIRTADDIAPACRELAASASLDLATRIRPQRTRDTLVLPTAVAGELDLAIAWARARSTVLDDWGFASRVASRGLSILLAGKPGTGKTSAAHVLATELGLDLLHVDLAQVVNKYIGETEKRLARLFDEAGTGAVLFFDEADALFGRRTQVRDAHDRHANIEVGYLLQRIEQHDGVTLLATNRHGDLDEAFLRRFHVSIMFPIPEAADRARLWQRMLPAEAPRVPDLPLDRIAADYELAGGDILVAALSAAVLAADAREPICGYHLYRGIQRVLAKNGLLPDARLLRIIRGEPDDVTRSTLR